MPLKRAFLNIFEGNYATKGKLFVIPNGLMDRRKGKNITVSADRDAEYRAGLRPATKPAKIAPEAAGQAEPLPWGQLVASS